MANPSWETAMRPLYDVIIIQKKVSEALRENCLQLKDSLEKIKPWNNEHYASNLQIADSLVARVEAIIVSLNEATTYENDLEKYPLNQLPPLHDSLTRFESGLRNELCKGIDATVYFTNDKADLREYYLFVTDDVRFILLTKIQADIYLVLRNYYSCELTIER